MTGELFAEMDISHLQHFSEHIHTMKKLTPHLPASSNPSDTSNINLKEKTKLSKTCF